MPPYSPVFSTTGTTRGCSGNLLSTVGNLPAFTCSANNGDSLYFPDCAVAGELPTNAARVMAIRAAANCRRVRGMVMRLISVSSLMRLHYWLPPL
jgi:hypothetical protein